MEWVVETFRDRWRIAYAAKAKLCDRQSEYQRVEVYDTDHLGRLMMLDGAGMVSEADEFVYHEMLVHTACTVRPSTERVLIVGGGDGGAALQALKYPHVTVDMVEIDRAVVEASQEFFPIFSAVWDHPRFRLHVEDGVEFVRRAADATYDAVLVDSTDPVGPAVDLFGPAFYEETRRILKPDGVCVVQAESPLLAMDWHLRATQALRSHFQIVRPLHFPMLIYPGGMWCLAFASNGPDPIRDFDASRIPAADLRYFSPDVHRASFVFPPFIEAQLAAARS